MAEIVKKETVGHQGGTGCKIVLYSLADYVWTERLKGATYGSITAGCNKLLSERQDGKIYYAICARNVVRFCRQQRDKLRASGDIDIDPMRRKTLDVIEATERGVSRIEQMLDKLKVSDGSPDDRRISEWEKVVSQLRQMLQLLATIKGQFQAGGGITIQVYNQNIMSIVNMIKGDGFLVAEDKKRLITNIAEGHLLESGEQA